jgi:hypothetical protein
MLDGSPAGGTWSIDPICYSQWNGQYSPNGPATVGSSSNPISFFWVTGGNLGVTYTYGSNSATASFQVAVPTVAPNDQVAASAYLNCEGSETLCGELSAQATVTPPSGYAGTLTYLQTVNSDAVVFTGAGKQTQTCQESGYNPPMLDGTYPYPSTSTGNTISAVDYPYVPLGDGSQTGYTNATRQNSFSMYLLWQPTGVGTSFPVPIYVTNWGYNEAASWASGRWTASGGASGVGEGPTTSYPTWYAVANGFSCVGGQVGQ